MLATSMSVIKSRTPEQEGWSVRGNFGFLQCMTALVKSFP